MNDEQKADIKMHVLLGGLGEKPDDGYRWNGFGEVSIKLENRFERIADQYEKAGVPEKAREVRKRLAELALAREDLACAANVYERLGMPDKAKDLKIQMGDRYVQRRRYFEAARAYHEAGLEDKVDEVWQKLKVAFLEHKFDIKCYHIRE